MATLHPGSRLSHRSSSPALRLGIALAIIHVIALVSLTAFITGRATSNTIADQAASLESIAKLLSENYKGLLRPGAEDELRDSIDADARATGLALMIARRDAPTILASSASVDDPENAWFRAEVADAASSRQFAFRFEARERSEHPAAQIWGAWPIETDGRIDAVLTLSDPTRASAASDSGWGIFVGLGAASLGIMIIVIGVFHVRFRSAIDRLLQATHAYSTQDLDHRVDPSSMGEIGAVGISLNEMAEELGKLVQLLHARRNEQDAILQSMGNGVIAMDLDRRVLNINRAAAGILGGGTGESRGRLLHEITRHPELHEFVERAINAPGSTKGEIRVHDQFPPTVLQVRSKPLTDEHEDAAGLLVILEDVTELRRLERIRTDFAANVSHELRTPITNIKGYLETMDEVGFDDEEQSRRFLNIIQTNADRLGSIIEDLLALARLESTELEGQVRPARIPVAPLVASAVEQVRDNAQRKHIEVISHPIPEIHILAVSQLIEQALSNLLSNAIKYSPANTVVDVSVTLDDEQMVCLTVQDQGPGIPPEHHERLFERFYRVDKARSRALGGTGLGLAIVKHIAHVHGGAVTLESAPGAGSTFRIVLPLADAAESPAIAG